MSARRFVHGVLVCLALLVAAASAPSRVEPAPPDLPPAFSPDPLARLEGLSPQNPRAYFLLAEEFLERAGAPGPRSASDRTTARTLLLLAADLSSKAGDPERTAPSALLALAALAQTPDERQWLEAVANAADAQRSTVRWGGAAKSRTAADAALNLAVALGRYRAGDYRRARDLLRKLADPAAVLAGAGFDAKRATEIIDQISAEVTSPAACPRCRGERVLKGVQDGKATAELCPLCRGNPAPTPALTAERFNELLRAEALLLEARPTTWSAQARIDGAAPLRDVDVSSAAAFYKVDLSASLFRGGRWTAP